jgi:glycosyltransferase involved in cell wall biosynthesis
MAERIRVVEIIYSFGVEGAGGGAGRFGAELGRRLDQDRFEATVCGLWDLGTPLEQERIAELGKIGINAFAATPWDERRPLRSLWRAFVRIRRELTSRPPHLVHSHSEFADVVALLLKLSLKTPVILRTVHNGHPLEWRKRPLRRLLFTNLLYPLFYDQEVGVNQDITHRLNRRWLARRLGRQAICRHNAIDLARFTDLRVDIPEKRRTLGIPPAAFVVGNIGRMVEGKGQEILIEAAALVLKTLPEAFFVLVGDGELAGALHQQARSSGVYDRTLFTGPRTDVEEVLACFDLCVIPSLWEGISTVILESMASGIPVVATDIPGNRELLEAGKNAWLVPAAQPQALADAILTAWREPEQRQTYAQRARAAVRKFSLEAAVHQHEEMYLALFRR